MKNQWNCRCQLEPVEPRRRVEFIGGPLDGAVKELHHVAKFLEVPVRLANGKLHTVLYRRSSLGDRYVLSALWGKI